MVSFLTIGGGGNLGGITTGDAFTYLNAVIGYLSRQERQV
ncbi:unnamed protein product [Brassica oleracea]